MSTIAQAAKHIFINERTLKTLLDVGAVTRQPRDAYDLNKVRKEYIEHLRQVRSGVQGGGASSLSEARARVATAHAESAERKNAREQGDFIDVETMLKIEAAKFTIIREILLNQPARLQSALQGVIPDIAGQLVYQIIRKDVCDEVITELGNPKSLVKRAVYVSAGLTTEKQYDRLMENDDDNTQT